MVNIENTPFYTKVDDYLNFIKYPIRYREAFTSVFKMVYYAFAPFIIELLILVSTYVTSLFYGHRSATSMLLLLNGLYFLIFPKYISEDAAKEKYFNKYLPSFKVKRNTHLWTGRMIRVLGLLFLFCSMSNYISLTVDIGRGPFSDFINMNVYFTYLFNNPTYYNLKRFGYVLSLSFVYIPQFILTVGFPLINLISITLLLFKIIFNPNIGNILRSLIKRSILVSVVAYCILNYNFEYDHIDTFFSSGFTLINALLFVAFSRDYYNSTIKEKEKEKENEYYTLGFQELILPSSSKGNDSNDDGNIIKLKFDTLKEEYKEYKEDDMVLTFVNGTKYSKSLDNKEGILRKDINDDNIMTYNLSKNWNVEKNRVFLKWVKYSEYESTDVQLQDADFYVDLPLVNGKRVVDIRTLPWLNTWTFINFNDILEYLS